jgi:hypothetical protein
MLPKDLTLLKPELNNLITKQPNVRFIPGQGPGPEGHAERVLYDPFSNVDGLKIGIFRAKGPCPECQNFFDKNNFSGLFWP